MVLLYIILFVVLLVVGLLFVPIQIFVDTEDRRYFASLRGLARASLESDQKELLRIRLKVLFFERCFYPLRKPAKTKKKAIARKTGRKRKIRFTNMLRFVKSFKVKKFSLDMDTGDYVVNAKLYPVFILLDRYVGSFQINFHDKNRLVMDVRNNPFRILRSFIY